MGGLTFIKSIGRTRHNTLTLLGIAITSVIAITLLGSNFARAQSVDTEGVSLTPSNSLITLDAGEVRAGKIKLINSGTVAYSLTVYARPYSIRDNNYSNADFSTSKSNADLYSWLRFTKTSYKLQPNATVEVPYTINVPKGAAPGGHYGVIFAEIQSSIKDSSANSIIRNKRVGSLIYATVNGQLNLNGDVDKGHIPFWQVEPPLRASVAARNTGNTHFKDTVQLVVRDIFGRIKYRKVANYQIVPDTTRTIDLTWDQAPWFGLYKVEASQTFLDKSSTSEGYVLMMPRYIILLVAFILVGGAAYFYVQRKKKK